MATPNLWNLTTASLVWDFFFKAHAQRVRTEVVLPPAEMIGISWHFGSFSFLVKSKLNWCSLGGNSIRIVRIMCWLHNMSPLATVALQEDR